MAIKTRRVKDIGELRHQCSLYYVADTEGLDGSNKKIGGGSAYAENIWCNFQPFSPSKEQIIAERSDRYESHYFGVLTIPHDDTVLRSEMECEYDGIRYRMVNKTKYGEAFYFLECICVGTKAT
jgi:hypothetical protein